MFKEYLIWAKRSESRKRVAALNESGKCDLALVEILDAENKLVKFVYCLVDKRELIVSKLLVSGIVKDGFHVCVSYPLPFNSEVKLPFKPVIRFAKCQVYLEEVNS